ncbi:MAG: sodium:proton antiporter [Eubacterium sp.]|nr:sodium:proton antiporter [Eubacterium sp.]
MSVLLERSLLIALAILGVLVFFALIYAAIGRRLTDKIIAINMIGTIGINMIVILALFLEADYILDIGLVFALLSFLTVIVFCRYAENREMHDRKNRINLVATDAEEESDSDAVSDGADGGKVGEVE